MEDQMVEGGVGGREGRVELEYAGFNMLTTVYLAALLISLAAEAVGGVGLGPYTARLVVNTYLLIKAWLRGR